LWYKTSKNAKKDIFTEAGTQTDHIVSKDAETQTTTELLETQATFLKQSLTEAQEKLEMLWPSALLSLVVPAIIFPYPYLYLIASNLKEALHTVFSQNTPLRKQILQVVCKRIDLVQLVPILGFSLKTLQRAMKLDPQPPIGLTLEKKKRESRIHPSVIRDAHKILDVIAPIKSGKVYRVVSCPLNYLYEQYHGLASQISRHPPLSYPTFITKILDITHNYVHFEDNPDFCPLCRELDELQVVPPANLTTQQSKRILELQEHQRIAKCQWAVYHNVMENLLSNPTARLVVQDFNQQHGSSSLQTQVLTLVVYVIACHRDFFFRENTFITDHVTHVDVFNDGGPKHFKLTAYLAHMCAISEIYATQQKSLVQHFFASYHGSGPADAVASHMKKKIHDIRANFRHNPKSVAEMAQLCSTLANTDKAVAVTISDELLAEEMAVKVETFTGIKKYHKATFAPQQTVSLWVDSSAPAPTLCKSLGATGLLI